MRVELNSRSVLPMIAVVGLLGTAAATADPSDTLETIVVTSNKRAQDELSVAASVDVLDAASLQRDHIVGIEDLGRSVPNVAVAQFGDGQYRLIYRGLGATGASDNQNFNVAYDGVVVPYGNAYRLLDLEQVEVLRGPQGTLYGRNTSAGLINIVPRDGSSPAPVVATVDYGTANTPGVRAAFGGPVDDSGFFYRVAVRGERTDGFISNSTLHREDTDESRNGTVRTTAGWKNSDWTVRGSLTYDRYHGLADDLTPASTPFNSIAQDVGTSSGYLTMPIVTASYNAEGYTVTSVTAYANTARLLDFSAVVSPLLFGQFDRRDSLSQEIRFSGDRSLVGHRTNWITGIYLLNENDRFVSTLDLTHPITASLTAQNQREHTQSAALFGEAITDWTDQWRTTLGLRVADEHQKYDFQLSAIGALLHSSESYPAVQPKFVLAYLPNRDSELYASATRGFRAGAVFVNNAAVDPTNPSYKQETTWQYEMGYKSLLASGHLKLDAAVFYIDWNDLQVQRSILSVAPPGVFSVVDNAAKAKSSGAEGNATWRVGGGLQFFVQGGFTNASYEQFNPTPTTSYSGNRIEEVPVNSVGAGVVYTPSSGFDLGLDVTRYGKMWYDAANSISQQPYTLLNGSLAYAVNHWRFSVVGRNLLGEHYGNRGLVSAGQAYIHAAPPATVLGEVTYSY